MNHKNHRDQNKAVTWWNYLSTRQAAEAIALLRKFNPAEYQHIDIDEFMDRSELSLHLVVDIYKAAHHIEPELRKYLT